ncbi:MULTISPECIES: septum formation initiator [unclassified Micromonospora]|uniref:septum formation initiator n=1 Tax=unclassified Micromonospora TaxID=2617518 RepID=UPI001C5DE17C|nr:septum formation initiator [Micromonospora sp. RL09-050-HVF-A]MBW4700555.1 septum formation initiator [Micromonospora sp. RL09-050-HVF-A]
MGRRAFLATAGWLAAAVLATLIGVAAIRLVGESITGTPGGVRSQAEVERALAAPAPATPATASPGPAGPGPSSAAASSTPGLRRSFSTPGGTAVAECVGADVRLVSWAPAQDYRVKDVDRGPDDDAEVTFAGPAGEFEVKVGCIGGEPVARPGGGD